ncbi:MAG: hypothetical protein NPIRA05_02040 [Nitrospirales bacterium]|nr:MAG: hypothetical protein NPIRA05_02040 [Nitrospirales bacterium]
MLRKHLKKKFDLFLCKDVPLLLPYKLAWHGNVFVTLLLMIGLTLSSANASDRVPITQSALQQIQALAYEKSSRSPVQQKISSRLWYASKMRRGDAIASGVATLRSRVEFRRDNTTLVDIQADISESVLAQIEAAGGTIVNQFPKYRAIRAKVSIDQIEQVAGIPEVQFIKPVDKMMTNSHNSSAVNISEGDVAHKVDQARESFGVDGTGIKIGVLSDGVDSLSERQATGDLPDNVTVLPSQAGSGDEGTAMLEIVHDLVPGAELLFATAFEGQASFATNIKALRAAGAEVIVDDIFYFAEPVFQDGIIAQAVNSVGSNGGLYFSSAGNSGNVNDGTSGAWEGDFEATVAPSVLGEGVIAHDFGEGNNSNPISTDSPFVFTLTWADPQGSSGNDYDLYLLSADLTEVFDASTNVQSGTQDPFEIIDSELFNDVGNRLVIVKNSGQDRYLHLNTHRGQLEFSTAGQTSGHAAASGAFGVAAVDVSTANGGTFTGGSENPVETFSSDGPRQIFFEENGTPITPGNFSSTGGAVRQKPDLAAADGVSTSTPGFNPFFGTSAAAPHAAAIAALVLDANPNLTSNEVWDVLTSTALDIEDEGVDRDSGFGIIDAFAAVGSVVAGDPQVTNPVPGDTLNDSSAVFEWSSNGTPITDWWLYVGKATGKSNVYNSGPLDKNTLSALVDDLPINGGAIYVRLWYKTDNWSFVDAQYTAISVPKILEPRPLSLLRKTTVTFKGKLTADDFQHWMWIGTKKGKANILNRNMGQSSELLVQGLPKFGRIFVRYWTKLESGWRFRDQAYFMWTFSTND